MSSFFSKKKRETDDEGTDMLKARDIDDDDDHRQHYLDETVEYEPTPEERRREARADNLEECRGICIFFFFAVIWSISMLLDMSDASSRLASHVRAKLDTSGYNFEDVANVDDFYEYVEKAFIPSMFENNTDTRLALGMSNTFQPIDSTNRMVGSVQFRQLRVAEASACQVSPMFSQYTISCYPPYRWGPRSTESKAAFGPNGKFQFSDDPNGAPFTGDLAAYHPNGFIQYLSVNSTKAKLAVKQLKEEGFLGKATRAGFLDFTVWSQNTGTFLAGMLVVEFGPTGNTKHSIATLPLTHRVLEPGGSKTAADMASLIFTLIIILFVIWYVYEEGKELVGKRLGYFKDPWNVLDWINLILILISFAVRILVWAEASARGIGKDALANKENFVNLRGLAIQAEMIKFLGALNSALVWLKCAKYLRKVPVIKELIRKVWVSLELFVPFLFMFTLAFIGFVIAYNVGFGDKIMSLSTFSGALVYLTRAFLRDVKLMPAYDITPMFGAMMILLFYVSLVLVGVTVVNAIFCDAIYRGKFAKKKKKVNLFREEEQEEEIEIHEDEPVEEFGRYLGETFDSILEAVLPKKMMHRWQNRVNKLQMQQQEDQFDGPNPTEGEFDMLEDDYDDRDEDDSMFSSEEAESEGPISRRDVLRAIEHMSGRVLSEVSIVGIEIRSELHDICERVAQMQMAVEELTWRTDKVKDEQDYYVNQ